MRRVILCIFIDKIVVTVNFLELILCIISQLNNNFNFMPFNNNMIYYLTMCDCGDRHRILNILLSKISISNMSM